MTNKTAILIDTNVFLTNWNVIFQQGKKDVIVPYKVLEELDKHKKRQDSLGNNARNIIRFFDELRSKGDLVNGVQIREDCGMLFCKGVSNINILPAEYEHNNPDNQILAVALEIFHHKKNVTVLSQDINLRIKCAALGIPTDDYREDNIIVEKTELYRGWREYKLDDDFIDRLYAGEEMFIEDSSLFPNEFLVLKSEINNQKSALCRWVNKGIPLRKVPSSFPNDWGFVANNKEQLFALDLLFDPDVPIVSLAGPAGTGKSVLSVLAGLSQVNLSVQGNKKTKNGNSQNKQYKKLFISRPIMPMGKDIGYLPGSKGEKLDPWIAPIRDNMAFLFGGDEYHIDEYIERKIIEIEAPTYIRGRSIQNAYMMIDECFTGEQYILTIDENKTENKKRIKHLFSIQEKGKKLPLVMSYNEEKNCFEEKQLLSISKKQKRDILEIRCSNRKIKTTHEHPFLTLEGWKKAENLSIGDALFCYGNNFQTTNILNEDQKQIVYGSFLGDGHIHKIGKNRFRLRVIHGIKQNKYCEWKANMMNADISYIEKNGYSQTEACRFNSKVFYSSIDFESNKKNVPEELISEIDERGLAIWFMDDGSFNKEKNRGVISVCSFTNDSVERLSKMLFEKFGIENKIFYNKNYPYIRLQKAGVSRVEDICSPYIHSQMSYKIKENQDNKYTWLNMFKGNVLVVDDILLSSKKEEVYDLEVEDNHNFILCSSSGGKNKTFSGPVVHNCQNLNRHEMKTIMTRVGYNTKIVLTGDLSQIDNINLDEYSSGLTHLIERLKHSQLSGHVYLDQGERSEVATLCAEKL